MEDMQENESRRDVIMFPPAFTPSCVLLVSLTISLGHGGLLRAPVLPIAGPIGPLPLPFAGHGVPIIPTIRSMHPFLFEKVRAFRKYRTGRHNLPSRRRVANKDIGQLIQPFATTSFQTPYGGTTIIDNRPTDSLGFQPDGLSLNDLDLRIMANSKDWRSTGISLNDPQFIQNVGAMYPVNGDFALDIANGLDTGVGVGGLVENPLNANPSVLGAGSLVSRDVTWLSSQAGLVNLGAQASLNNLGSVQSGLNDVGVSRSLNNNLGIQTGLSNDVGLQTGLNNIEGATAGINNNLESVQSSLNDLGVSSSVNSNLGIQTAGLNSEAGLQTGLKNLGVSSVDLNNPRTVPSGQNNNPRSQTGVKSSIGSQTGVNNDPYATGVLPQGNDILVDLGGNNGVRSFAAASANRAASVRGAVGGSPAVATSAGVSGSGLAGDGAGGSVGVTVDGALLSGSPTAAASSGGAATSAQATFGQEAFGGLAGNVETGALASEAKLGGSGGTGGGKVQRVLAGGSILQSKGQGVYSAGSVSQEVGTGVGVASAGASSLNLGLAGSSQTGASVGRTGGTAVNRSAFVGGGAGGVVYGGGKVGYGLSAGDGGGVYAGAAAASDSRRAERGRGGLYGGTAASFGGVRLISRGQGQSNNFGANLPLPVVNGLPTAIVFSRND